jgi:OmpA-OmpF porin, OOP family
MRAIHITFAHRRIGAWAAALCVGLLMASTAQAAVLRSVRGEVEILRGSATLTAVAGQRLQQGDVLQSAPTADGKPGGEALMRFDDGARMALRNGSAFELQALKLKGPSAARQKTVRIIKGSLRYISGKATVRQKVAFVTSTATIGIRGTDIEIAVSEEAVQDNNPGTYLKVNTGAAVLTASDGAAVDVTPGEVAYGGEPELVMRGKGGTRRASARKVQAVGADVFKASGLDKLMR